MDPDRRKTLLEEAQLILFWNKAWPERDEDGQLARQMRMKEIEQELLATSSQQQAVESQRRQETSS